MKQMTRREAIEAIKGIFETNTVYDSVLGVSKGDALFALRLVLK